MARWAIIAAIACLPASAASAQTYTFDGSFIDTFANGGSPTVYAVSPDGRVVAGWVSQGGVYRAFRWDGTTMTDLGHLGGNFAFAYAMSLDGSVVVGSSRNALGNGRAFWWSGGTMTDLGTLGGASSTADGVSADGTVIVGSSVTALGEDRGFRWSGGSMIDLGTLPGDVRSTAVDVSADGTVITGHSYTSASLIRTYRWSSGTMVDIGSLAGGDTAATGISADGATIVGYSVVGTAHAFRWSAGTMTDLHLGGYLSSFAKGTSGNGSVVVGYLTQSATQKAFRWTGAKGTQTIEELLTASGHDMTGWQLRYADDVSDDGTVIVGEGRNPANTSIGWILRCVADCDIIDTASAAQSFAGLGTMAATGSAYLGAELGAMGAMASAAKNSGTTVTGFAYGAFDSDPTTSATIGATYSFGNDLVVGGSLGAAGVVTYLPFDGSSSFSGPSATLFVASAPDAGFNWLAGVSAMALSGTVSRGYLNGNTQVASTGSTTGSGAAFTAEAGFTFADLLTDTLVTPFVNVTVSSISYGGYTETGGPFPASFSAFTASSAIVRMGAEASYEVQDNAVVTAGLSYGHNFGNGGTIAGSVPGIIAMSVPGSTLPADFLEASVGLDMPIRQDMRFAGRLAVTVPFAGPPSIQARAALTLAF